MVLHVAILATRATFTVLNEYSRFHMLLDIILMFNLRAAFAFKHAFLVTSCFSRFDEISLGEIDQ